MSIYYVVVNVLLPQVHKPPAPKPMKKTMAPKPTAPTPTCKNCVCVEEIGGARMLFFFVGV